MFAAITKSTATMKRLLPLGLVAVAALLATTAQAAAPGISGNPVAVGTGGSRFNLTAAPSFLTQPDGQNIYSWGYGCTKGSSPAFLPKTTAAITTAAFCNTMQVPGPTLIVYEGDSVSVTLTNNLPTAAGNTSILFPGFNVTSDCGATGANSVQGLLTCEATPGNTVTYTFTASTPGTRAYYSGTQSDLQVEMGLYGAIIVLPSPSVNGSVNPNYPYSCDAGLPATNPGGNAIARSTWGEQDFRLATAAYDNPTTCYDREYLFQFSEMDPTIHNQALAQVLAKVSSLQVPTEPYHPAYFMINGRSMPDDMDPNYSPQYPNQPYNGDPHMHPGEVTLLRIVGTGRWQHPFHEHANHVRILARDGNLILAPDGTSLAGPLMFTTTTTPGLAMDGLFYFTGRGLNWDMYGHNPASTAPSTDPVHLPCTPDANGYNTGAPTAINYFEWCQDHNKPMQASPFGDVPSGGPMTLPDPNLFVNGFWYGGSPYLGPDATTRAVGPTGTTPPSGTVVNPPSSEAGFAFMWHSHNEREITTNNIFPGGMLMMMLVDSREFKIDESN